MTELTDLLDRHARVWATPTPVPRLLLCRADAATAPAPAVYHPLLCVLARGRKRATLGDDTFDYDPGNYLVTSADLPVTGRVTKAPLLGCVLTLNLAALSEWVADVPPDAVDPDAAAPKAMGVHPVGPDLLDPIVRLVRLLDRPADVPVLAPMIEREILYRLLCGPKGTTLRQAARPDAPLARIARATALSPLQFQKQLRLREARRLLMTDRDDTAGVAFAVGYESPSQFGREYRRLFGVPPGRDRAGRAGGRGRAVTR